ncbi:hypothetical protein FOA52_016302 [Chlamydomonas sp. UWO 241]|nr:hypothetical protein FOA52_016302 [Chlamydomonas sp. UWO 241]
MSCSDDATRALAASSHLHPAAAALQATGRGLLSHMANLQGQAVALAGSGEAAAALPRAVSKVQARCDAAAKAASALAVSMSDLKAKALKRVRQRDWLQPHVADGGVGEAAQLTRGFVASEPPVVTGTARGRGDARGDGLLPEV